MDAGIVGHHQTAYFVRSLDVRTLFAECDLDRGGSPVDEICKFLLPDSLERFMDLSGINLTLYDVEYGHVLSLFGGSTDHDVVWMKKSPHNIEDSGFFDV